DTGPLHLAAALKIPAVAIFGPTDPARNGPYGTRSVVLRNPASTTTHARNPRSDEAMLAITVDAVIEAARSLLVQCAAGGFHCWVVAGGGGGLRSHGVLRLRAFFFAGPARPGV